MIRQGSNALDSSYSTERFSPVMLRSAQHLAADRDRPFAALRVTNHSRSWLVKIIIGPYGWPE